MSVTIIEAEELDVDSERRFGERREKRRYAGVV